MKRLYYATNNLDDAEAISDEVHSLGIDDHHFFVLSRDENGINTHHLHGGKSLENTEILAAKKRANFFALLAVVLFGSSIGFAIDAIGKNIFFLAIACCAIFAIAKFIAFIACKSFDEYFKGVFDDHLDNGEVIVVIDVKRSQFNKVESQLSKHPAASFIADSSNIASPIPN
ncbi:MAG: hypothetical protein AAFZ92_08145 [Pseudomonadota bacterium]